MGLTDEPSKAGRVQGRAKGSRKKEQKRKKGVGNGGRNELEGKARGRVKEG